MRTTIAVTIPYTYKFNLCPLLTTIFLVVGGLALQAVQPLFVRSHESTIVHAERAVRLEGRTKRWVPLRRDTAGPICGNSTNGCWGAYSIENDTSTTWPNTGVTVEYNLTLTNSTCAPEGFTKPCFLVNGQFPGPTIQANWGDIVKVTVNNQLRDNGTTIHWHGIRQLGTNEQDGVGGLTECPLPPGQSRTYQWQATQYGTSWYHSHFSAQYGEGIVGPIVINGPASAGYDFDMGPVMVSEVYKVDGGGGAAALDIIIGTQGPLTDTPNNVLFNGINVNAAGGGKRLEFEVQPGARHLMRFINTGVDNHWKVGLDNHMLEVVAIDLTPVKPYMAQWVSLGVGQRFDAIVTANQSAGAYWLRAMPTACAVNKYDGMGSQNAIIRYAGAPVGLPTSKPDLRSFTVECLDEPADKAVPFVAKQVGSGDASSFDPYHLPISSPFQVTTNTEGRVFRWTLGKTTQVVDWQSPILQRFVDGNNTVSAEDNLIGVDSGEWAYWYLQNNFFEAHPIHMHGNELSILATGPGQWDEKVTELNFVNPIRRDTFMLPAGGYAILAFQTDNPGIWLMHCHIAWHASEGLSTSLYVKKDQIQINKDKAAAIKDQCVTWNNYLTGTGEYAKGGGGSSTATGQAKPNAAQAAAAGGAKYPQSGSGV